VRFPTLGRIFICLTASLASAVPAFAADYYVNGSGGDGNSGTSPGAAWRSLARVSQTAFAAGDRILLAGGQTFTGSIAFGSDDRGTPSAPIVLTSYGVGRATIAAGSGSGVYAYNTSGLTISNLIVAGSGAMSNTESGVEFFADLSGGVLLLAGIRIDDVDVSGFGQRGISVGSWDGTTGYRDVVVTGVAAHDNGLAGIATFAAVPNVHQNVYVGYCGAYNNTGVPGWPVNSGNGIVLGNVAGATIERSAANGNGWFSTTPA